jgi:hypothetical protein
LIISIGWITQVASIPEAPPLTKGLTAGQTPRDLGFSSPICVDENESGKWKKMKKRGRERIENGDWAEMEQNLNLYNTLFFSSGFIYFRVSFCILGFSEIYGMDTTS